MSLLSSNSSINNIYLIGTSNQDLRTISYISSLNPICWTDDILSAKTYKHIQEVVEDIIRYKEQLQDIVLYTDMTRIFILHFNSSRFITIIDNEGNIKKEVLNEIYIS